MISSYVFQVKTEDVLPSGRAYAFYSCLLSLLPPAFGERMHLPGETPIAQYIHAEAGTTFWRVNLLDQSAEEAASPVLDGLRSIPLHTGAQELELLECARTSAEDLMRQARELASQRYITLRFLTPTAFRQAGNYVVLPEKDLILQSLINKWNAAFPNYPMEDSDALQMLSDGLRVSDYRLRTGRFLIKDCRIPGFFGSLNLDTRFSPPILELWKLLLVFAERSGIGIKTALGMGGVKIQDAGTVNAKKDHAKEGIPCVAPSVYSGSLCCC